MKKIRKRELMDEGMKVLSATRLKEYKCPLCGGVASIWPRFGVIRAECHACGTRSEVPNEY